MEQGRYLTTDQVLAEAADELFANVMSKPQVKGLIKRFPEEFVNEDFIRAIEAAEGLIQSRPYYTIRRLLGAGS